MKKISNIKKINNNYEIKLSDNTSLSFCHSTIIKYNLIRPKEVSDKLLNEMIYYDNMVRLYNKCIKCINIKLRTKKEIKDKLKDYDKSIVDKIIYYLEKNNYINDYRYIDSYINDQINLRNIGPNKIKNNLILLELDTDIIDNILNNIDDNIWIDKINKIILKKVNSNNKLVGKILENKIRNDLYIMGYPSNLINKCISNIVVDNKDMILEKEFNKEYNKLCKRYSGIVLKSKIKSKLYNKGFTISEIDKYINLL